MCAKARAETHEPKITGLIRGGGFKAFLQGEQHGRTAHIAVVAQHPGAGLQGIRREDRFECFQDISTARMSHDPGHGPRAAPGPQARHGAGRQLGHGAVQEVAEFAIALFETQFVPFSG